MQGHYSTTDPLVRLELATKLVDYLVNHGLTRLHRDEVGKPGLVFVEYRRGSSALCMPRRG